MFLFQKQVPEHPVVSPSSGQVYERRLIEKYVQENGIDPVSQKPLSAEDLVPTSLLFFLSPIPAGKWKRISCKHNARWPHLSRLKASAFFALQKNIFC
jgi:hypothetical protein